jgi:hypothetical protein
MTRSPDKPIVQSIEEVVDTGAKMYNDRRKEILNSVGDVPYGSRRLSQEEELTRYRTEQREDPQFWKDFIDEERQRLGLPEQTADGMPLIPKTVLSEMVRLENRHRRND